MKLCTKSLAWCVLIATHLYIYVLLKKSQPPSTFQLNNILDRLLSLLLTSWLSLTTAPPDSLGTAEVTATRRLTGIATTQPVQRITQTDLTTRGVTDIADALRRLAGVNLRDYGGAGGLKTVSVRGLGAGHTAVTYDGLAVNDSRQGQIDLGQFSSDRLEALSLQTMGSTQLLSPVRNLAAAVVGIETPWNKALNDNSWHGKVALRQASFGTYAPSVALQKQLTHTTAIGGAADYFVAQNNYPFVVKNGVASEHLHRNNSRMQTVTTELNLHQTLMAGNGGELMAKAYFHHNYRHLPGMVYFYVNENNERLLEQVAFGQVRWQQRWGRLQLMAATKHNWQTSQYTDIGGQYPGGALHQNYWQRETYVTAGAAYAFTPWLSAAYATDGAFASLNSNQLNDNHVKRDTWLQSLSAEIHTARLTVQARGIFHQYWNMKQAEGPSARNAQRITPSLSASWLALRSQKVWFYARASYKEGFRMPTFTESYYYHLGSTSLQPELTRQVSMGLTLQATPSVSWWRLLAITADGYFNQVKDRIVSVPYNLFVWRTINMGRVRAAGLDVSLQSEWQLARQHKLLLAMNYSWQRCRDFTSASESTWHKQLAYTPEHSGGGSFTWQNPWLWVVMHTTWASRRWCSNNHLPTTDLPAYSEWGFSLSRSLHFKRSGTQLNLRADLVNAFDHRYEVIAKYPMPGRAYKLEANFTF